MTIHPMTVEQQAITGASHMGIITYADLTDADDAQSFNLAVVAAKMGMLLVACLLKKTFVSSDATLISTAITCGDAGSATRFLSSTELNEAGTEIFLKPGAINPASLTVYTAADNFIVAFAATSGKALNTHTQGEVHFWLRLADAR